MRKMLNLSALFLTLNSFSQSFVSVNYTQIYSNLVFTDADGKKNDNLRADFKSAYAINYQKYFEKGLFIRAELGYKAFGAVSNFGTEKLSWDLNYIDANIGGGYMYKKYKVRPYIGASFYGAYLIRATQMIGADYYDMLKNKAIKNNDFGVNGFIGILHSVSDHTSVYLEVAKTKGLNQLETSAGQLLYNTAVSVRLGVSFLISKNENKYGFMITK